MSRFPCSTKHQMTSQTTFIRYPPTVLSPPPSSTPFTTLVSLHTPHSTLCAIIRSALPAYIEHPIRRSKLVLGSAEDSNRKRMRFRRHAELNDVPFSSPSSGFARSLPSPTFSQRLRNMQFASHIRLPGFTRNLTDDLRRVPPVA